jgi:predicted nucleotide-binding protein (sugar kinase/HSP70/actin superfamily)
MKKVSIPYIGDYYIPAQYFIKKALKSEVVLAPKITKKTVELGNKYSPQFVCMPFKYTLGTFIEAIDKGADTLIQLGGGCRYGYYGEVQEKILKDLGYDVDVITLVTNGKVKISRIYKELKKINKKLKITEMIYYGFITIKMIKYMDIIDEYIRENIAFEMENGKLLQLKQLMLLDFSKIKGYMDLKEKFNYYKEEFKNVKIRKPNNYYKIGIIGELYTLMEPNANYFLEKELAKNNIEIKRFTNATYLLLEKKKFVKKYLKYTGVKYNMGADASDNIIRTKYLCDSNYDGIIHIKSSFCTPEIAAMPVINKIASDKGIPVLFFSFDANTSETGIKTRLEAFYDMLEMRGEK